MLILLVILGILILVVGHEFGHFIMAKIFKIKVEEFGIGMPPRLVGKKYKETLYSLNALPLGGFVKIYGEEHCKEEDKDAFLNRPFIEKAGVVVGGILINFILAWLFFSLVFMIGEERYLVVADVVPNSPAYEAGIIRGDFIVKAEIDHTVFTPPLHLENVLQSIKDTKGNIRLFIKRGNKELTFDLNKRKVLEEKEEILGIALAEGGVEKQDFLSSLISGFKETVGFTSAMVVGIGHLIKRAFMGESVLQNLAGPVGVVSFAVKTAELGLVYFLKLLGLISVNLAVINLFPLPALDGGRLLLFVIEKVRGKKISLEVQSLVTNLSFLLLFVLMFIVTYNDIRNLLR